MSWKRISVWSAIAVCGGLIVAQSYRVRFRMEARLATEAASEHAEAERLMAESRVFTEKVIPRGVSFSVMLQNMGIDGDTTAALIDAARPVFDFRTIEAGNELIIGRTLLGELVELRYDISPEEFLSIARHDGDFEAKIVDVPITTSVEAVAGKIDGSLFDGVTEAGESPELAMRIADIFSWDLDFYTDPRPGDTFRVVVEKKFADGKPIGYGKILAAEYDNDGRPYRAILFHDPNGNPAYYSPAGKSLKKAFLHSPLKFAAVITSHFSYHRFHPILKYYRPHLGTDYAAPIGTPVQSIGDGRVIFAARKGGDGNLVKVQHTNGYVTYYMHLSRILVRGGQHVSQGETIGRVGMTGLATGPHLDFRIERHGTFMNFERLPLPPSNPVARSDWAEFAAVRDREMALLPQPGASVASASTPTVPTSLSGNR